MSRDFTTATVAATTNTSHSYLFNMMLNIQLINTVLHSKESVVPCVKTVGREKLQFFDKHRKFCT